MYLTYGNSTQGALDNFNCSHSVYSSALNPFGLFYFMFPNFGRARIAENRIELTEFHYVQPPLRLSKSFPVSVTTTLIKCYECVKCFNL